ncbi:MAG: methyltransferase domain-containing protein [Candidatus Margulisbacteria bacterium]|nr:methyltransferase domain-containing protein [Candidatus Margulisiibacteriota bacterium]
MTKSKDWDPEHYLKFKNERTQPSIDLVSRIDIAYEPGHIADIGCGPGNSSQVLSLRWPGAELVGVDNSPAMIAKAKKEYPANTWVLSEAMNFAPDIKFDIIFSNATIQWIPRHKKLFAKLITMLSEKGVIAIQIPKFQDMLLGRIIRQVSQKKEWKKETAGCEDLFTCHDYHFYYNLLSADMQRIDMWETDYLHVMPGHSAIVDWIKSTGLKPYLDRIPDEKRKNIFEREILKEIKKYYPVQKDGRVLFPFKRLFFIAYK